MIRRRGGGDRHPPSLRPHHSPPSVPPPPLLPHGDRLPTVVLVAVKVVCAGPLTPHPSPRTGHGLRPAAAV
ncbi:hypothetical protein E2C01_097283 [Portunus trituberculatus]|uniref:Uncharacterized protein n=1 Tax=Portunus trituberculatus TaxID=210409 RepID=A0A5B7K013_PORTR|nr:hypothetical protein [Portunus trituberculatus]